MSKDARAALQNWEWSFNKSAGLPDPTALDAWKKAWQENEDSQAAKNEAVVEEYGASVERNELAGVPDLDVRPRGWDASSKKVLIYTHGGAYTMFSAASTLTSSVPTAHDAGLRVVSVDYTVAPFAKFKEITDQVLSVVRALLAEGRGMKDLAIYGDSAGGGLAAGSVLKMRDQGLGMPSAVVLESPWSDITESGDTYATLADADLLLSYAGALGPSAAAYADPRDHAHPTPH